MTYGPISEKLKLKIETCFPTLTLLRKISTEDRKEGGCLGYLQLTNDIEYAITFNVIPKINCTIKKRILRGSIPLLF